MKTRLIVLILASSLLWVGCSDFLDTVDLTEKTNATFPIAAADYDQAIAAVYASQRDAYFDQINSFIGISSYLDDDYIANGRALFDDPMIRGFERYQVRNLDQLLTPWQNYYKAIYRANFVLESLDKNSTALSDAQKASYRGQACYLRASSYFDLCRLFGGVPLKTNTVSSNPTRATVDSCFARIASDLKKAAELLPAKSFQNVNKSNELFNANKYAAEAMMARVFLFYTGVYGKPELPLAEGGSVSKSNVLDYLHDVINTSGYGLVDDFRNLWLYSFANVDYKYAKTNNLSWIGEKGNNNECLYMISFSGLGTNNQWDRFQNSVSCSVPGITPFGAGSGMSAVNPKVYEEWDDADLRKTGSIWNVKDAATEGIEFSSTPAPNSGKFYFNSQSNVEETGYFQKKYCHIYVNVGGKRTAANTVLNGTATKNNTNDATVGQYIIRFSDVLLMAAELGSPNAQLYFDKVRSRAYLKNSGNTPIADKPFYKPATLANIQDERRHEFAFEGIRWYDLLRWKIVDQQIAKYKTDVPVYKFGVLEKITIRYRPETKGLLPIPQSQINLSNGVLKQNEGWGSNEGIYSGI
ncbi:RagB/SusD family nutrient uptake outer membrane protein [Spirosoma endbachense]|uniref:RagB/SusD family nutrient uptake outer membrane protein n=1 Tax=Spirosoma endbachense TaxID=2666025 RepID=A0A6P1VYT0_9BACT|nr:RagB/SusD family nutrient uptake outer membrane protein [Spirosoma endbachense]QHV96869.1 RagB/SusD family nutrient uptake outer membrane protein [Spirosoma endbachense]